MQLPFPVVWHIMSVAYDLLHQDLGIKYQMAVSNHAPTHSQYASEDSNPEQYGPPLRYFEIKNEFRV
jgi:hypothetical protein